MDIKFLKYRLLNKKYEHVVIHVLVNNVVMSSIVSFKDIFGLKDNNRPSNIYNRNVDNFFITFTRNL